MLPLNIRQYRPSDKKTVHLINQESLEISFRYYYDLFHEREPDLFQVAEYESKIVGFILVKNGINLGESHTGLIYAIAVTPQYRSLGIGTELVSVVEKILKEKAVKKFYLHVRTANKKGVQFYERLGFTVLKKIEKFYSWGEDAYRMMKSLE